MVDPIRRRTLRLESDVGRLQASTGSPEGSYLRRPIPVILRLSPNSRAPFVNGAPRALSRSPVSLRFETSVDTARGRQQRVRPDAGSAIEVSR